MANKIQLRRGNKANLPSLDKGEPAVALDTSEVFIGGNSGNIQLATVGMLSQNATARQTYSTVAVMKTKNFKVGDIVETLGYFASGDGGAGLYEVKQTAVVTDEGSIINLSNGMQAYLITPAFVSYKMFGAKGDGVNNDGVQIKNCHNYANSKNIPVNNPYPADYYVKGTNYIPVKTSVYCPKVVYHIDESLIPASSGQLFDIEPKLASYDAPTSIFADVLPYMQKGVKEIPPLAQYKDCFIRVINSNKKVSIREGANANDGEDLMEWFYMDEAGWIVGDITWNFDDITRIMIFPVDDDYLVFDGGTFLLSGNITVPSTGDYRNPGFVVKRSRTIIRNQVVGFEFPQNSNGASSGFYLYQDCFDYTLENIKNVPRKTVYLDSGTPRGTYGISLNRVLKGQLKNITAQGHADAESDRWGVFQSNFIKDTVVESCELNRLDSHIYSWNWTIKDSVIGGKGFTLVGGGHLNILNCRVHNYMFVNFRGDYGARWDGDITIKDCTWIPRNITDSEYKILAFYPNDTTHDYGYPLVFGRKIVVENMTVDFSKANTAKNLWLVLYNTFATTAGTRIEYPTNMLFKDIRVIGADKGFRFLTISKPDQVYVPKVGSYTAPDEFVTNANYRFENIDVEPIVDVSQSVSNYTLWFDVQATRTYTDGNSLYPKVHIKNCKNLALQPKSAIAHFYIEDCEVNVIDAADAGSAKGRFDFIHTKFKPNVTDDGNNAYYLDGAYINLVNCQFHPYKVNGVKDLALSKSRLYFFTIDSGGGVFTLKGKHIGSDLTAELHDYLVAQYAGNAIYYYMEAMKNYDSKPRGITTVPSRTGTTAQRPTTGKFSGLTYFDQDLKKLITWNNPTSAWYFADGTVAP